MLVSAHVAARYAHPANVGLLYYRDLNGLYSTLEGKYLNYPRTATYRRDNKLRNVLHVLSYAQPIGVAWRWIQEDRNSLTLETAITTQSDLNGKYEIPQVIKECSRKLRWLSSCS